MKTGITGGFIIMAIASILAIVYIIIFLSGSKKQKDMLDALDSKKYPAKDLYAFGLQILSILKYRCDSMRDRKIISYCGVIYGTIYAEYYYRIFLAQILSIPTIILIVCMFVSVLMDELVILLLGFGGAIAIGYYYYTLISDVIKLREQSIMHDFPDVLSKLGLLVNAGMIMHEAWDKVSRTGDGVLYLEMRETIREMQNGMAEIDAYLEFSRRCGQNEVNRFTSMLIQNLAKGNKEIVEFLKAYSAEEWELRKNLARKKGEEASSKLLIPITLMFVGLLIMIGLPIMSNLGM